MSDLMTVTFMPRRNAPSQFKKVQYFVECTGKDVYKEAEEKAVAILKKEHDAKYYQELSIVTPTRIIK